MCGGRAVVVATPINSVSERIGAVGSWNRCLSTVTSPLDHEEVPSRAVAANERRNSLIENETIT
jgi:hypothetical protein